MGLCFSIPIQQSLNDEIREIEHLTSNPKSPNINKLNSNNQIPSIIHYNFKNDFNPSTLIIY